MLNTIVGKPTKTILYGATLTAVALVIALLAVSFTTGSAQAQDPGPGGNAGGNAGDSSSSSDSDSADSEINLDTYDDPQPCGPGAGDADMDEPHKITTGHYALFDAYWRTTSRGESDIDVAGAGVLHTNLCPPEIAKEVKRGKVKITRSPRVGGMEVDEAIMHVLDKHKATTVATNAEATDGQLSLEEYPRVGDVVDPDDDDNNEVWWLRLDDPRTTDKNEKSDLSVGFSTLLLDKERWNSPMRYKFEVERHPTNPGDVPHFFAYEAPNIRAESPKTGVKLVWDSAEAGRGEMLLSPGEFRALQWVFTKPGTYLLWVHLLGEVKQPGASDDWKPISKNATETSEVYRYTFQVGNELDETEPPIFGVNRSVAENSLGGVKVGDPIPVYNAEADTLYYELTGKGHSNFETVVASTDPHAVQIVVADGADLDYEDKEKRSYELNLTVTDRVDHEHNKDLSVDDVLIVRINVEDQEPGLVLEVDRRDPGVSETVNFTTRYEQAPEHVGRTFGYQWEWADGDNEGIWHVLDLGTAPSAPSWSVAQSSAGAVTYRASVVLPNDDPQNNDIPTFVNSNDVEITWSN